jgi:homogentisate 1,2-dioxygenase
MCAEHTFRPPYYHRNVMSEFMGLVGGSYDAKKGGADGFVPGGASLHGVSTPHGPDAATFAAASAADTSKPSKFTGGLAFMFETTALLRLSKFAAEPAHGMLQTEYYRCWEGLPRNFKPPAGSSNGGGGEAERKKPRRA